MWRPIVLLLIAVPLAAQTEGFVAGKLFLANGDTLVGRIEPFKEERLSRSIKFVSESDAYPKRYSARDVKAFDTDNRRFESYLIDDKDQFVKVEQAGELSLFSLKDRVKKGGEYETTVRYFVRREGSQQIHEITERNFKKEMPIHISDYIDLAEQVRAKYYRFSELQALVEAYNLWVEKGRPPGTWTKENGNYTLGVDHAPIIREKAEKETLEGRLALESFAALSLNIMEYDEYAYQNILGYTFSTPGPGYQVGVGLRYRVSEHFTLRGGLGHFNKSFRIQYLGIDITTNEEFRITETWSNRFFSGYAMAEYQSDGFFFGGGFDLSFAQTSSQDFRAVSNMNGDEFDLEGSLLIAQVEPQFDFLMNMGFNLSSEDGRWRFRPNISYAIPLNRLFTYRNDLSGGLGNELNTNYQVSQFNFRIGLIVEYNLN